MTTKYEIWYNSLIEKRRKYPLTKDKSDPNYVYCERHHIVPKCLGGSNSPENIVNLTSREHFIAHILLVKIYQKQNNKNAYIKMSLALFSLKTLKNGCIRPLKYFSSRLFEKLVVPSRTFTEEHRENIKKSAKHRVISEETKRQAIEKMIRTKKLKRLNGTLKPAWNKGIPLSEETKKKMKATVAKFNKNKGRKATTESKIREIESNLKKKYPTINFDSFDFSYYVSIPRHKIQNGKYLRRTVLINFLLTQISEEQLNEIMTEYKKSHNKTRKGIPNSRESLIKKAKTFCCKKYPKTSFENFNFEEYIDIPSKKARKIYLEKYVSSKV